MSLLGFVAAAAGAWMVLACVGGFTWSFAATRLRRTKRIHGAYPSCIPVRPPVTQADIDAMWLDAWPTDVEPGDIDELEQRVYDRLFDDLIAIEGIS